MTHAGDRANPSDEARLVQLAAQGDEAALERLLSLHRPWVYNVALRMVHDPDDAEDVTQEVLIKIARGIAAFEGRSSVRTWIYRIVSNHMLNMRRRRAEEEMGSLSDFGVALDGMPDAEPPDPRPDGPELPLILREVEFSCTRGMLLCLSRDQRLAFILGGILLMDSVDGGEAMGISPENFRQLLHRARRDLYAFMEGKCGLVNHSNPCRCARKTRAFINAGVVDPSNLRFADSALRRVEDAVPGIIDAVEELEARYAMTFRNHPFAQPASPDAVRQALNQARRIGAE
jgi:RNA polymerase sigma factor (sigma-70 family)